MCNAFYQIGSQRVQRDANTGVCRPVSPRYIISKAFHSQSFHLRFEIVRDLLRENMDRAHMEARIFRAVNSFIIELLAVAFNYIKMAYIKLCVDAKMQPIIQAP